MHYTLTPKRLQRLASYKDLPTPDQCYRLLNEMRDLGLYLLNPATLSSAAESAECGSMQKTRIHQFLERRALPNRLGQCVIIVSLDGLAHDTLLRQAFPLALRWCRDQQDSPKLPPKLKERADYIKECLNIFGWGLTLDIEADQELQPDLSALPGDFPSADLSLAISLCLAENQLLPRSGAFVSASWQDNNLHKVGNIKEKFSVALWFRAEAFFAHEENLFLKDCFSQETQHILRPLTPQKTTTHKETNRFSLRAALSPLFADFGAAPQRSEGHTPEHCLVYANLLSANQQRAQRERYILHNLTDFLASREKQRLQQISKSPTIPQHQRDITEKIIRLDCLVVIPSAISSSVLSILATSARSVLVLYTDQIQKEWERLYSFKQQTCQADAPEHLRDLLAHVDLQAQRVAKDEFEEIARYTIHFLRGKNGGVDVTGGTKGMAATVALAAQKMAALVFSISSENTSQHTAGTEQIAWIPYSVF